MTESPLVDSSFVVPVFSPGDDLISCINKAMAFLTAVASSRFPSINNQLRTSSNLRNQATIQDGRVTLQQYKEKAMLAEAQEAGQILDEEQLAFLVDPWVPDGQALQTIIPNNFAFQTKDLDTYDSDCDDISNAKAVLMANISNYGSDVISEVTHSKNYLNDMENQDDMIKEKLALKEQVDSLEQNLSKQIKENECLLQIFTAFKRESKEKEDKNIENEIDFEKKLKELDNIIFKVGQSAQTVHILKPFYDNIHKKALEQSGQPVMTREEEDGISVALDPQEALR
nr:hypothetical protein [Tanacetum cinerariifolium]